MRCALAQCSLNSICALFFCILLDLLAPRLFSMASPNLFGLICLLMFLLTTQHAVLGDIDYGDALTKSLMFYEAQRSGKLPSTQRVQWRGDSGLKDGSDAGVDLVGGYYDAGDNVKFGFPMAFTITMLSWSTLEFTKQLEAKDELSNALDAIKWGTDYLINAHTAPNVLYGEVGDGDSDHECWQRPEDMTTPRTTFKIDEQHPGSDLAGETAAALAAASIAFKDKNPKYASDLLTHAKQDELLWAASWLHRATDDKTYLDNLGQAGNTGGARTVFAWDDKFIGAQVLVAKLVLEGKVDSAGAWGQYKSQAEQFICSCIQKGNNNVKKTPGGLLWFLPWNNLQYTSTAVFVATAYSEYLNAKHASIQCPGGIVKPSDLIALAQSQVDYILGSNPEGMSFMVGFGTKYPTQVHHRGASIVSIKENSAPISCKAGFDLWFNKTSPNPNVLDGAIVGGPDENDGYSDSRSNFQMAEPATVSTAPLVGVLARLALVNW
ncbi:unnamed protein product [Malus baccata var. baccata]